MSIQLDCFEQRDYDQGLCGCLGDPVACLCATCLTPCAVGYYVGKSEGTDFNLISCLCASSGLGEYRLRRNIAAHHGNPQSGDGIACAVLCPCTACCALAQDIHEWGVIEKKARMAAQQRPPEVMVMPQAPPPHMPPGSPVIMGQPMKH